MILVSCDQISHIARGVLVQLLIAAEDKHGDIDGAEHGQLMRLLEKTALSLQERDRAVSVVLDGFDLNLSPSHFVDCKSKVG